jgi:hypothetical protein
MRTCTKCNQTLPETEFYLTGTGALFGSCKECTKARVRANYRRNREHYREYERRRASLPHRVDLREAYARTPEGRARGNWAKRRYVERNPVKQRAHYLCGNAIRDGRLRRQPCEVCGNESVQAHHDDYGKPLDVRWLCTTHHAEWHRHNTPICPEKEQTA